MFHDDFLTLFPKYWSAVPANYEYIAVGMIPRHFDVAKEAVYGTCCSLTLSICATLCPKTEAGTARRHGGYDPADQHVVSSAPILMCWRAQTHIREPIQWQCVT